MRGAALFLAMFAFFSQTHAAVSAGTPITFGIVPQYNSPVTARRWGGIARALEEMTGTEIQLLVPSNIRTFEACLDAGAFDLAYMSPYHVVVFSDPVGYTAIAHRRGKGLSGIVIVRKNSGISQIEDLAGARLAFPAPAAFGASLMVQAELRARGIPFEPVYVRSHENVYRTIQAGAFPAGGGVRRTFQALINTISDELEIVFETAEYTPHAIGTHPNLDPGLRNRLQAALITLHDAHADVLAPLGITGWQAPAPDAYEDVRTLEIDPRQAGMGFSSEITCPFARN